MFTVSTNCTHTELGNLIHLFIHSEPVTSLIYCGSALLKVLTLTGVGCGYERTLTVSHIAGFTPSMILKSISPSLCQVLEACLCYPRSIYSYWGTADPSICKWSQETFIYIVAVYWKQKWTLSLGCFPFRCTVDLVKPCLMSCHYIYILNIQYW